MGDDTNTTHVTTTSSHGNDTSVELDGIGDLTSSEIDLHSVIDLDVWVGVSDAIVMSAIDPSSKKPAYRAFANLAKAPMGHFQPKLGPTADRLRELTF